ncbi:hypothetical protein Aperf_G00000081991 [Anoplocephala perfoliata]
MSSQPFESIYLETWEKHIRRLFSANVDKPVELKIQPSCEIIWERHEIGHGSYGQRPVLYSIMDLCGEINESTLPGVENTWMYEAVRKYKPGGKRVLEEKLSDFIIPFSGVELISQLLVLVTWQRLPAKGALSHSFFVLIPDNVHDLKCLLRQSVIHRDLKPDNLLISPDGVVKISDFGFARMQLQSSSQRYTPMRFTMPYESPEQMLGHLDYTDKIDMWAAGCIMSELYTGRLLFPERDYKRKTRAIKRLCGPVTRHSSSSVELRRYLQTLITDLYAVDLIVKFLKVRPSVRISAADALRHHYFGFPPREDSDILRAWHN